MSVPYPCLVPATRAAVNQLRWQTYTTEVLGPAGAALTIGDGNNVTVYGAAIHWDSLCSCAALKEYGFQNAMLATYNKPGATLTVRALRFGDLTGAYGAYSYYRGSGWPKEDIGTGGASDHNRVLFWRGDVMVDATFSRTFPMSGAELRELADVLPRPKGNAANAPPLLAYMAHRDYVKNTEKYVVGPVGLAQAASPVPVNLVDFAEGTEVVLGKYHVPSGEATLMVISYPTPQIAAEHMKRLDAAAQSGSQPAGVGNAGPLYEKRSGPLLAVVSGQVSASDAKSLLGAVNYDADVTWNQNTSFDKKNNLANLLVNIILLCGVLIGLALVAGLAFGGIRVAAQRLLPGRVFGRPEEVEFIALHLEENRQAGPKFLN